MQVQRKGSDLKIAIRLALHSLGRDHAGASKGMTIAEMETFLKDLRREQIERGILKPVQHA